MSRTMQQAKQRSATERRAFIATLTELQNELTQTRIRLRQATHLLGYLMASKVAVQEDGSYIAIIKVDDLLEIERTFYSVELEPIPGDGEALLKVRVTFQEPAVEAEIVDGDTGVFTAPDGTQVAVVDGKRIVDGGEEE